jgi:hypothetical protein
MPRDNVFVRFEKRLAGAAKKTGASRDKIVDGILFEEGAIATTPANSRTVPAGSRKTPASRRVRVPV